MQRRALLTTFAPTPPTKAAATPGRRRGARASTEAVSATALEHSRLYSEELGIELGARRESEYFRWFLASILFGARISETIARHTFHAFQTHDLVTPRRIFAAGWDFLVNPVMREGGYVRYDGRKSTQILRDCEMLIKQYGGRIERIQEAARTPQDLEERMLAFYGIGPVTVNIFLRELRPCWRNADPEPLPVVRTLAKRFRIDLNRYNRKTLRFVRVEAGLLRLRHGASADNRPAAADP